jgi:cytochrome c553
MKASTPRDARRRHLWWISLLAIAFALAAATALTAAAGPPSASARAELRVALAASADATRGAELFGPCGACHGPDGRGVRDGSVPAIAAQHASVLIKQLVDFRQGNRWDIQMEHAARMQPLDDPAQIADLAAYVSRLPRSAQGGVGNGQSLDLGARTYFRTCERCHGPLGEGDARRAIPRLAGQHQGYLFRQFFDAVEGRRPNMSALHLKLMRPLSREQIDGISDYLSRVSIELTPEVSR